jgi:alpha-N-acetylglucosaminidase
MLYVELLNDLDSLVATDSAFLIGPWIESARGWGVGNNDCGEKSCPDFYEWNARVQLTSWNPTPKNATQIPDGPIDYASKHWSGLIKDYYAERAEGVMNIALKNGAEGKPLDNAAVQRFEANLSYSWTNNVSSYPVQPVGNAISVSKAIHAKYAKYFSRCVTGPDMSLPLP